MALIHLHNVAVSFPLYDVSTRSLKNSLMRVATGGKISSSSAKVVTVDSLRNVSFRLEHGDRLGLIGHNGAGKSTLLRVLAGIYQPMQGVIKVEGSVVPLFEMSLGMDLDATGYDNIKIRAALLGIKPKELELLLDDIVAFTDLGNYLHMPLRAYSQGMMMRLAFAVSTAISPEILLLDEWIGVGDAHFIKKAEDRMNAMVAKTGILVLASHNNPLLREVCNKGLVMEHGEILFEGEINAALDFYEAMRKE
jgi:ABC-type polysaccharide/polyol phosphate transport system ATPase subunit